MSNKNPQGVLLYRGPSNFDKDVNILAIATGFVNPSSNRKTGGMIQVFIVRDDQVPSSTIKNRTDQPVCGDCKHGARFGRSCYVNTVSMGVNVVYKTFHNGKYPQFEADKHMDMFAGRKVRFGAYGDPAAVPFWVWEPILDKLNETRGVWTSYTHSWGICDPRFKEFTVASVDNPEELARARAAGWRTYRTLLPGEELEKNEHICPASDEYKEMTGRELSCAECHACDGLHGKSPNRASFAIRVHGTVGKINNYVRLRVAGEELAEAS